MKHLILVLLSALSLNLAQAQCNGFFPMKEKVKYQYDHFDKKEKLSLRTTQTLKDVKGSGNSMTAIMVQEMIDVKKEKIIATTESDWACEGGTLHFEINQMSFDNPQQSNAASGMTMDVTGDKMDVPSDFEVGQKLKDLTYNVKMTMSGMSLMNRTFKITDRKVETTEQVTTPAGTFECYKVTYKTSSQGGIGSGTVKSVSWFAKNVGMVKTETFSESDKLISRQILSKIEK
jgi:hypothetical protein